MGNTYITAALRANDSYTLVNISEKTKVDKDEIVRKSRNHFLLLDGSGSMWSEFSHLLDDVKKCVDSPSINEDDYITVMVFSDPSDVTTPVKYFPVVKKQEFINNVSNIKAPFNCTCFSAPLDEVEHIINDAFSMADVHDILLFTDGCPCVSWGSHRENEKVLEILERIKTKIVSFNAIGYGNWCDEDNLKNWCSVTPFGEFYHSDKITDYSNIFNEVASVSSGITPITFTIESSKKFYYVTDNNVTFVSTLNDDDKYFLEVNGLTTTNQIIVEGLNPFITIKSEDDIICIDNNTKSSKINDNWRNAIIYKMAYGDYLSGNRKQALARLGTVLRDKGMVDSLINAFTAAEKERFKNKLKYATFRNIGRDPMSAPENYIPPRDAATLLELLGIIRNGYGNKFYTKGYKRIGKKTTYTEEFNFTAREEYADYFDITDIVFSAKDGSLNVNIATECKGHSIVNEEAFDTKIIRNFNVIKDGRPNMETINLILSKKTVEDITKSGRFDNIVEKIVTDNGINYLEFEVSMLPVVNEQDAEMSISDFFELTVRLAKLEAEFALAKFYHKKNFVSYESKKYDEATAQALAEAHIRNGIYSPSGKVCTNDEAKDQYMARQYSTNLKGFSTLSKILEDENGIPYIEMNKTKKKKADALAEAQGTQPDYSDCYKPGDIFLAEALRNYEDYNSNGKYNGLREEISEVKAKLMSAKLGKVLTGSDFTGLIENDTDPDKRTYTAKSKYAPNTELTLNIKTTYVTKYID